MHRRPARAGQGLGHAHGRRRVPAALRVPLLRPRRPAVRRRPQDLDERTVDLPGLRQHRPQPARGGQARGRRTSSTSTTTTTTPASARSTTSSSDASCTAEIVWDLMREPRRRSRRSRSPRRSTSGSSPTPGSSCTRTPASRAHLMAAELIEAGVDVHGDLPAPVRGHALRQARAARRARCAHVERFDDGALTYHPPVARRLPPGRRRGELLRGHHRPPALRRGHEGRRARARAASATAGSGRKKVSLRATDGEVDVSRHRPRRRAAAGTARRPGFSHASWRRRARRVPARADRRAAAAADRAPLAARTAADRHHAPSDGRPRPRRQAGGQDVARHRRRWCAAALRRAARRARRHARPVRDRPAARPRRPRDAHPALRHGAAEDLRGGRALRRGLDDGRPRGRDHADRACCRPAPLRAAHGPAAPAPARLQRRPRRRPAGLRSARGRGEEVVVPEREVRVHALRAALARGRPRRLRDRVLVGDLRAQPGRRPRRRLLRGAAAHRDRAVRRRGRRPGAASSPLADALALPARAWRLDAATARAAPAHGRAVAGARCRAGAAHVLLVDDDGPIAIAERAGTAPAQARRRLPLDEGHPGSPTPSRGRAASPSAPSTASTSATARSSRAPTPS